MSIEGFLSSRFGPHPISRVFLANLFDHCRIGHLDAGAVKAAFRAMQIDGPTDFDLDEVPTTGLENAAKEVIFSFRDHAKAQPDLSKGAIQPDPLEICELVRAYKLEVYERHLSAIVVAARLPDYVPNPLTKHDEWPNWFTQNHDLVMRSGVSAALGPTSAEFVISRLGLIHFWDKPTSVCLLSLGCTPLAGGAKRPTSIDAEVNPAYLAVSQGEEFGKKLLEMAGVSAAALPDHGRALELWSVERDNRLKDGGIEVIIPLTNLLTTLATSRGKLFAELAQHFLFRYNHDRFSRSDFTALGNGDIFLNVINVEAHQGLTEAHLVKALYGLEDPSNQFDRDYSNHRWFMVSNVLRPLTWIGFLEETRASEDRLADRIYWKTPLWSKCLTLDTDRYLTTPTRH